MSLLSKTKTFNRRAVLSAAAILPASAATAFVAPVKEAPAPDLPDWWRKLTTQVQALNETAVPHLGAGDRFTVVRKDRLDAVVSAAGLADGPQETPEADPHVAWLARWKGLKAEYERIEAQWKAGELSDADFEEAADLTLNCRWDLVKVAATTPAKTVQGTAAMAELLDLEYGVDAFGESGRCPDGQLLTNLVNSLQAMTGELV